MEPKKYKVAAALYGGVDSADKIAYACLSHGFSPKKLKTAEEAEDFRLRPTGDAIKIRFLPYNSYRL